MAIDTEWAFKVSQAQNNFKKSDRVILNFITKYPQEAAFLSLKELAEKTGTSKPTVIEFYRKLGYSSYKGFLSGVKSFYEHHIDSYKASTIIFKKIRSIEELIKSTIEIEIKSIGKLKEYITEEDLIFISDQIFQRERTFFFAPATGKYPAHFLYQRLKRYKFDVHFIEEDIQHLADELYPIGEKDLFFVFNYTTEPLLVERAMAFAKNRNAVVILITGSMYLSLASFADRVIYINRGDIEFKNSMAVPMSFANLLLLTVELRGKKDFREYLRKLEEEREEFKLSFSS